MSFFRNTASLLLVSGVTLPVQLVTSILLARLLSVEDRGVYGLAMAFAATVSFTAQLGLPSAAIFRMRRVGVRPSRVVASGLGVCLVVLVVLVLLGWGLGRPLTNRFLAGAAPPILWASLVLAMLQVVNLFMSGVARGIDRFDLHNAYSIVDSLGVLLVVGPILVFYRAAVLEALMGVLAVRLLATIVLATLLLRQTGFEPGLHGDEIGQSLWFGLKNYLQNLARQLHDRSSVLMLGYLAVDASQIAFFVVAQSLVRIVNVGPAAIATSLYPQLAGAPDQQAPVFTARVTRHAVFWSTSIALAAGLAGPFVVPWIYGAGYAPSIVPFLLLLPTMIGVTVGQVVSRFFMAANRQRVVTTVRLLALAVNVGLNLWLIPRHGILGASVALLVSGTLEGALVVAVFVLGSKQRLRETLVVKWSDREPYLRRLEPIWRRIQSRR